MVYASVYGLRSKGVKVKYRIKYNIIRYFSIIIANRMPENSIIDIITVWAVGICKN